MDSTPIPLSACDELLHVVDELHTVELGVGGIDDTDESERSAIAITLLRIMRRVGALARQQ